MTGLSMIAFRDLLDLISFNDNLLLVVIIIDLDAIKLTDRRFHFYNDSSCRLDV